MTTDTDLRAAMAEIQRITPDGVRVDGEFAYVRLTKGYEAKIDVADVSLVSGYEWMALVKPRKDGSTMAVYACRTQYSNGKRRMVWMHRIICGTPEGLETDHIDGDGLNNCRANLRPATKSENMRNARVRTDNSSGSKGVTLYKRSGKWLAQITLNGKRKYLGYFNSKDEASDAYANASAEIYGDFGRIS